MLVLLLSCTNIKPNLNIKGIQEDKLMEAIKSGDLDEVKKYTSSLGTIGGKQSNGWTILTLAAYYGDRKIVEFLLRFCSKVQKNEKNKYGWTPLMVAADRGNIKIVHLLLKNAVDINELNKDGYTALTLAQGRGHSEIATLLLKSGAFEFRCAPAELQLISAALEVDIEKFRRIEAAEIDAELKNGWTALMYASYKGYEGVVSLLLKAGAKVDEKQKNGLMALMIAINNKPEGVVNLLLKAGAKVDEKNKDGVTALMLASENGHEGVVKLLLAAGAKVDEKQKDGLMALMGASIEGHEGVVNLLLKAGAKVDEKSKDGVTALMLAIQNGHEGVVSLLLKAGAKVDEKDKDGWTALMIASENGHEGIVKLLLAAGAKVDEKDNDSSTAFGLALLNSQIKVMDILVRAGAKDNVKNSFGLTLLMQLIATYREPITDLITYSESDRASFQTSEQYAGVLEWLLSKKICSINEKDSYGRTALMLCIYRIRRFGVCNVLFSMFSSLLKAGANVDEQDIDGSTALMIASEFGYVRLVIELLKAKANVTLRNNKGETAFNIAKLSLEKKLLEPNYRLITCGSSNDQFIYRDEFSTFNAAIYEIEEPYLKVIDALLGFSF